MRQMHARKWLVVLFAATIAAGCEGPAGDDGKNGLAGETGAPGKHGTPGTDGLPGEDGKPGTDGNHGRDGENGNIATAPRIGTISPATGSEHTTVTIDGSDFSTSVAGNLVYFDGTPARVLEAAKTRLVVRPEGLRTDAARTVQISVITENQTSNTFTWSLVRSGTVVDGEQRALASLAALARTQDGTLYLADEVGGLFTLDSESGELKPVAMSGLDTSGLVGLSAPGDGSLWAARLEERTVPTGPDAGDAFPVVHLERIDFDTKRAERVVSVDGGEWGRFEVRDDGAILLLRPSGISIISPSSTTIDATLEAPAGVLLEDFVLMFDEVFAIGGGKLWREAADDGEIGGAERGLEQFVEPGQGEADWRAIGTLGDRLTVSSSLGMFDVDLITGARSPAAPAIAWVVPSGIQPLPDGSIVWRSSDLVGMASANEGVRLLAATAIGVDFVPEDDSVVWASPHDAYIGALFRTDAQGTRIIAQLPHGMRAIEAALDGYVMTAPTFTAVTHYDTSANTTRLLYRLASEDVAILGQDVYLLDPTDEGATVSRGTLSGAPLTRTWGSTSAGSTALHADDTGVWVGGEHGLSVIADLGSGGEAYELPGFAWVSGMTLDIDGALLVVQGGQVWRWAGAGRPTLVNDGVAVGPLPWEPEFSRAFPAAGGDYVASSYRGFVRVIR